MGFRIWVLGFWDLGRLQKEIYIEKRQKKKNVLPQQSQMIPKQSRINPPSLPPPKMRIFLFVRATLQEVIFFSFQPPPPLFFSSSHFSSRLGFTFPTSPRGKNYIP